MEDITGRQLIEDFDLNVELGAAHMAHLKKMAHGDLRKAEMAYNVGWNGMLKGGGLTYPGCLDTMEKKWEKFKGRQK